jgi:hypothetical protein
LPPTGRTPASTPRKPRPGASRGGRPCRGSSWAWARRWHDGRDGGRGGTRPGSPALSWMSRANSFVSQGLRLLYPPNSLFKASRWQAVAALPVGGPRLRVASQATAHGPAAAPRTAPAQPPPQELPDGRGQLRHRQGSHRPVSAALNVRQTAWPDSAYIGAALHLPKMRAAYRGIRPFHPECPASGRAGCEALRSWRPEVRGRLSAMSPAARS